VTIRIALLVLALTLSGCSTRLAYSPNSLSSKAEAEKTLERVLREQTGSGSALSVEVTAQYFSTTDRFVYSSKDESGSGASVQPGRFIYFDNIGKIDFIERKRFLSSRSTYIVRVYDVVGYPIFTYAHHNKSKAELFLDSVETLRR
jgi:hypothetical protein